MIVARIRQRVWYPYNSQERDERMAARTDASARFLVLHPTRARVRGAMMHAPSAVHASLGVRASSVGRT
jgi:hypothetical protein